MPRTLRIRSTGDDVKFLQEQLNSRPPTALPMLVTNGMFTSETLARVKEYQANNALIVDGLVGPPTWGKLLGQTVMKTTGFFVLGRDMYDRRGAKVILRGFNDPLCAVMDMTPDRLYASLKPGWAHEVAISSPFGILRTSVTPTWI